MASTLTKRPLPALVALVALVVLAGLVWWRVMHRGGTENAATPCPTHTASATLPAPGRITVSVLNATKRGGIAARARTALVSDGFNVPKPAANDSPKKKVLGVAEIRFGPKGRAGATTLRYYFPGARLVAVNVKTATVVVSLGAKYRSVATPAGVQAALRRDDVLLASGAPGSPTSGSSPTC